VPALPALAPLPRAEAPSEPARILEPADGAEIDARTAHGLVVRVRGPLPGAERRGALVLSLDGARPRPVVSETLAIAELAGGATLDTGAHDLVLAAVGADGVALDPNAGGVAAVRFFVGARPSPPPAPRVVCLAPSGTVYGKNPSIALDYVVTPRNPSVSFAIEVRAGGSRLARAEGPGPFALGAFAAGDHEVTLTTSGAAGALPGRCGFTVNPELERSP
jgi:hypothetical protein